MNTKEKEEFIKTLTLIKRRKDIDTRPNSWEWSDDIRTEIQTDSNNYPWRAACEDIWENLSESQGDNYIGIKRDERQGNTPIESLNYWLEIPRYPPIEVLLAISDAFDIYIAAGGSLSLEDVFFGLTKKGIGNYAAQRKRDKSYRNFQFFVSMDALETKNKNLQPRDLDSLAAEYLAYGKNPLVAKAFDMPPSNESNIDPESFLRSYRRWKKDKRNIIEKSDK